MAAGPIEQYRGLRNFNPGNITFGTFAKKWGADRIETVASGTPRFAHFPDMVRGLRAQAELLIAYSVIPDGHGGLIDTIAEAIYRYCPPTGPGGENKRDTEAYIDAICAALNCSRDDEFTFDDPNFLWWMLALQGEHEQGKDGFHAYVTDAMLTDAVDLALAS